MQYGKRVRGQQQYGGGTTHIPLRVNTAGMIPLIFAQAIVTFPAILGGIFFSPGPVGTWLSRRLGTRQGSGSGYSSFMLVVGFTYFYTDVMIQNQKLGDNLQRQGGFIPGIRPGKRTQDYITQVTRRITLAGALFLGIVAVCPACSSSSITSSRGVAISPRTQQPGAGYQLRRSDHRRRRGGGYHAPA